MSADLKWRYGNINDATIKVALSKKIHPSCLKCKWQSVCNGGYITRAAKFFGDISERDYYCPSLHKIYDHIEKRIKEDASLIQSIQYNNWKKNKVGGQICQEVTP